jgi:hypothetical protein
MTPDNELEEWRTTILRLLQKYELGGMTLRNLAEDLAAFSPAYERARGAIDDPYAVVLRCACVLVATGDLDQWESSLREFRGAIW